MKAFLLFFGWPNGQVWPNLFASVLWAAPAFLHLHKKIDRQHQERMQQGDYHHAQLKRRIDELRKENHEYTSQRH